MLTDVIDRTVGVNTHIFRPNFEDFVQQKVQLAVPLWHQYTFSAIRLLQHLRHEGAVIIQSGGEVSWRATFKHDSTDSDTQPFVLVAYYGDCHAYR